MPELHPGFIVDEPARATAATGGGLTPPGAASYPSDVVLPILPYGRQWVDDADVAAVTDAVRGDWLTQGPGVAAFEESLAQATGARHVVAVSSGTAALHLAALAAGVRQGTVGITSTVTFVASANAIRYAGGRPVLADVDPSTGLVSLEAMRSTARRLRDEGTPPRVLIPVDLTGTPADLPAVRAIAREHGALVIADAAHSLGASYDVDGREVAVGGGDDADMTILSFHPVKHITTAEGGAITTNDDALARELRDLRTHGITKDPARMSRDEGPWYYEQIALGYNYRITDLQCALGTSQMNRLGSFVARRRELAAMYDRAFAPLAAAVRPLAGRPGARSSYHLYVVSLVPRADEPLESVARRRKDLFLGLRERGIAPQVHYIPVHRQPDYVRNGLAAGEFPGAEAYYAGCISLPLFPAMKDGDVDRVVTAVAEILGS